MQVLSEKEALVFSFVIQMLAETEYAIDAENTLFLSARLGAAVTRVWAKLFRSDSAWEIIGFIGSSLVAYADLLDNSAYFAQ
jgi:hypothetical protein